MKTLLSMRDGVDVNLLTNILKAVDDFAVDSGFYDDGSEVVVLANAGRIDIATKNTSVKIESEVAK